MVDYQLCFWKWQKIALPSHRFYLSLLVFRPPVITGETTPNEGDTLDLDCDVSTSSPLPSVQWFNPQGKLISNTRDLEIMNIQGDKAGIYMCVIIQDSKAMLNSTVNVTVLCE